MHNSADIRQKLIDLKQKLMDKYSIKAMSIFGSYARNEKSTSDLDILIEFSGCIGSDFITLADELEITLGLKVDLVSRNGIKKKCFQQIETDLIYV